MQGQKIDKATIEELPLCKFKGVITIISTPEQAEEVLLKLENEKVIGFDTETKPSFKKGVRHTISLVQLSTIDEAFLFRVHLTGFSDVLIKIFNNPKILKIGIGIRDDLRNLNRIIKFKPQGFIEMQEVAKNLGIETISLKALTAVFLEERVSKRQRLSNWEAEVLSDSQIEYAAIDAWVALRIYNKLLSLAPDYQAKHFILKNK